MKSSFSLGACSVLIACSTSNGGIGGGQTSGNSSGSATGSSSGAGSIATSGAATGSSSGSPASGSSAGSASGSASSGFAGSASGAASGASTGASSGTAADAGAQASGSPGVAEAGPLTLDDGGTYAGTPFDVASVGHTLQLPGVIYLADYDYGGPSVAYCHGNPANCQQGVNTGDWRGATAPYRTPMDGAQAAGGAALDDNAGICHMNNGEPDNYAETGMVTLDGTLYSFTAGTAVSPYDTYICYMVSPTSSGPSVEPEWMKYTVQVMEAGTYSVGGQVGAPGGVTVSFDFGGGITTGAMAIPASPTNMCKCPETYHSWEVVGNLGTVTFAQPGTYVMTFSLLTQQFNPDFFVFTKM